MATRCSAHNLVNCGRCEHLPALPRLEQWERGWRVYCPDCAWNSRMLPFPDPDAAMHSLALHKVLCRG